MNFSGFLTALLFLSLLALTTGQICSSCECTSCDACNARRAAGQCFVVSQGDGTRLNDQPCVVVGPGAVVLGFTHTTNNAECVFLEPGSRVLGGITMGNGNDCIISNGGIIDGNVDMGAGRDCFLGTRTHISGLVMGAGDDVVLLTDVDTDSTGNSNFGDISGNGGDDCISIVGSEPGDPTKRSVPTKWQNVDDIQQMERPELSSMEAHRKFTEERQEMKRQTFPVIATRSVVGDINGNGGDDCILIVGTDFDNANGGGGNDDIVACNVEFERINGNAGSDAIDVKTYLSPLTPASIFGGADNDIVRGTDFRGQGTGLIGGGGGTDACCPDFATTLTAGNCEEVTCVDFTPTTQPPTNPPTTQPPTNAPTLAPTLPPTVAPTLAPNVPTETPTTAPPTTAGPPTTVAPTETPTTPPPSSIPQENQMIFTEIHANPSRVSGVSSALAEYFELLNRGPTIDLTGCTVGTMFARETITGGVLITGDRIYFRRAFVPADNVPPQYGGNAPPTMFFFANFGLGDGADDLSILCEGDTIVVASFAYDASFGIARGSSLQLDPTIEMTGDQAAVTSSANWCRSENAIGALAGSDNGTPNAPNDAC